MIWNHDNAWFEVKGSTDPNVTTVVNFDDVISLVVSEEIGQMDKASLVLLDRNSIYDRLIAPMTVVSVSWGIRRAEMLDVAPRKLLMYTENPSGEGNDHGQITYSANMTGFGQEGAYEPFAHEGIDKKTVVTTVMMKMGVIEPDVNFVGMGDQLNDGTKVVQRETPFRFLVNRAAEWGAIFRLGYDNKGLLHGCFCDVDKMNDFIKSLNGSQRTHLMLQYGVLDQMEEDLVSYKTTGGGSPNVISYKWNNNSMDASRGQAVKVVLGADGEPIVRRWIAAQQSVVTWRLSKDKIAAQMGAEFDFEKDTAFMAMIMKISTWTEAQKYFDYEVQSTAPQGCGYKISVKIMGDPLVTAGMRVRFGNGFPDSFGATDRLWWIQKATHTLSNSGYFTDLQIIDNYAFDASGNFNPVVGKEKS